MSCLDVELKYRSSVIFASIKMFVGSWMLQYLKSRDTNKYKSKFKGDDLNVNKKLCNELWLCESVFSPENCWM